MGRYKNQTKMKLSFLAIVASVKATFIPGGITPKTGNRVHHMFTASDRMRKHPKDKPMYGFSGDLISADFMGMGDGYSADGGLNIKGQQGQRDETWFYYQSPFRDTWEGIDYPWYRVIYMPWSIGGHVSIGGTAGGTTINGTTVYDIFYCQYAIHALLDLDETSTDAEKESLKEDCELKCVLFTEDTDWFNKRNCSDPAGSIEIGMRGSGHPWLQPLYDFEDEVALKIANGEETNLIFDFVPPHVVGSKIMAPETQDDVNTTQIENNQQLLHDLNGLGGRENMTVTVEGQDVQTMCRSLRSAGVNVKCGDEPDVNGTVVTTTVATTTTATVTEEDSGFLINSISFSLVAAMAIFN